MTTDLPRELDIAFRSLADWQAWSVANPGFGTAAYRDGVVDQVLSNGLHEPITHAFCQPSEIIRGTDLREGLNVRGIISRHRAVMHLIEKTVDMGNRPNINIYAPEAITTMALRLRGVFPKFIGSEFTLDERLKTEMYPIPLEDLTALSHPSNTFDVVTTNEVLEHVPSLDAALSEMARVLKPGGWHIGTHPLVNAESSVRKALIEDNEVIYLTEPEYHGDPFNDGGSLVFEIPGWDILQRALRAGFSDAMMRLIVSERHGCIASGHVGIFVLCCQK